MIKSNHALILNRLHEMQQAPYYATAKEELALAEQTILDLEQCARYESDVAEQAIQEMNRVKEENKRLMEDVVVQTRKIEEYLNKEPRLKILEEEILEACKCIPETVDLVPRLERYFQIRKG